mmetsp:Transcript_13144/g.41462  ORF Transcript_13144/g.41462 Transcript_13144/m.41462 type:complete len:215 (-) Transcript_13144:6-650(-)
MEYEGHINDPGHWRIVLRQEHHRLQRSLRREELKEPVEHLCLVRPLAVLVDGHRSPELLPVPRLEIGELLRVAVRRPVRDGLQAPCAVHGGQGVEGHDDLRALEAQDVADASDGVLQHLQAEALGVLPPRRGGHDGGDVLVRVRDGVGQTPQVVTVQLRVVRQPHRGARPRSKDGGGNGGSEQAEAHARAAGAAVRNGGTHGSRRFGINCGAKA